MNDNNKRKKSTVKNSVLHTLVKQRTARGTTAVKSADFNAKQQESPEKYAQGVVQQETYYAAETGISSGRDAARISYRKFRMMQEQRKKIDVQGSAQSAPKPPEKEKITVPTQTERREQFKRQHFRQKAIVAKTPVPQTAVPSVDIPAPAHPPYRAQMQRLKRQHLTREAVRRYCERHGSHARYQKRCYITRPQRRLVPIKEAQKIVGGLDEFMSIMAALPDEMKTDAIGQDMYDVMRQYITEYFNMHMRCMFELFLRRKNVENLHTAFETHAKILELLLTQLEAMTRENPKMYVETIVRRFRGRPCDPDISGADCPTPTDFRAWMRDLGTTFVRTIPNLVDYDSQDYHELICYYYHPRISACIATLRSLLDDNEKTAPQTVDDMLEQRYKTVEDHWIDIG